MYRFTHSYNFLNIQKPIFKELSTILIVLVLFGCGDAVERASESPKFPGQAELEVTSIKINTNNTIPDNIPPRAIYNKSGDLMVVWETDSGSLKRLFYRFFSHSDQSWSDPKVIAMENETFPINPKLVSIDEKFIVYWSYPSKDTSSTHLYSRVFNSTKWSRATKFKLPDSVVTPKLTPINSSSLLFLYQSEDISNNSVHLVMRRLNINETNPIWQPEEIVNTVPATGKVNFLTTIFDETQGALIYNMQYAIG